VAEVFAEQLAHRLGGTGRVLVPQSADGRDVFAPIVRESGVTVTTLSTYGLVTVSPSDAEIAAVQALAPDESFIVL
jgi:uroporphyrinogen-III synthase